MLFKELASTKTSLGLLSLRKRRELKLDVDVYEIKLGDEFLMSSLFTQAEEELARLGLAAAKFPELDVLVGGLGLGYTARAALENDRVRSLTVIEYLDAVIHWHQDKLLPLGATLTGDARCRFLQGDFFALAESGSFDAAEPEKRYHAILLDIDHAPDNTLHQNHNPFYTPEGLRTLLPQLHPGGVFALWSDDPPEDTFVEVLETVFDEAQAHVVSFDNPLLQAESSNTVYVAVKALTEHDQETERR